MKRLAPLLNVDSIEEVKNIMYQTKYDVLFFRTKNLPLYGFA